MDLAFFETPADFRAWLDANHATTEFLRVDFYKKGSGRPSIAWPESVDEVLCYGWIDGVRKRIDDERYAIRFTPRRQGSVWSSVNVARVRNLSELGLMRPTGLVAFHARKDDRSSIYSHEQGAVEMPEPYLCLLRENVAAWDFYRKQPASYRKAVDWWIASVKKEETRRKRLESLVAHSARGEGVPQFTRRKPSG